MNSHWLGPELDLDRAQRQAERDDVAAHRLQHRLDLIEARLGEIWHSPARAGSPRGASPGQVASAGLEPRIVELEDMELDLEPGHVVEAGIGELCAAPADRDAASRTAPAGRRRNRCRTAPSRSAAPTAGRGTWSGSAIIRKSPPPSISGMPKPPPAVNTGNTRLVRGVLGKQRRGDGAAVAHDARGVRPPSRVLPRRMPC